MIIRRAIETDAPGIAAVIHTMKELHSITAGVNSETTTAKITGNLRHAATSDSTISVAETADGAIVGYCAVHWVPFLFFAGGEAYVTELFVRPGDSDQGIGSRLLDEVIAEARRRGCSRVSLLNGRNSEAYRRGFYAMRGWMERDRMANFVLSLGEPPPCSTAPT